MSARSRWFVLCSICWAIGSICLFWPDTGWAADAKTLEERFRQVEKMSKLDRDRLQRNLAEFKKLTPEQQAHYRDLHSQVEKSDGHLSSLLQEYSAWLTTLTPSQRDELNNATDTAQKLGFVRQFKEAQEYRPESAPAGVADGPAVDLPKFRRNMIGGPPLKGPELAAVMNVISRDLHGREQKKPDGESTLKYYSELLKSSIEKSPDGPRNWPSEDLRIRLELLPGMKDHLKGHPDGGRVALIRLIMGSLANLAFENFKPPTQQDRDEVFNKLSTEKQAEIVKLRPDEGQRLLVRMYYIQRGDDTPQRMQEFRHQMDKLLNELGMPPMNQPPLGGGPGGSRRPHDGRPFGPDGGRPGDPSRGRNAPDRPRGRPGE